jgi:hypothetical protein
MREKTATLPAPSILTERPRAMSIPMTARQIAADANRLIWAEVTSISRANEPNGARIRKMVMAASQA